MYRAQPRGSLHWEADGRASDSGIPPHTPRRLPVLLTPTHPNEAELEAAVTNESGRLRPAGFAVSPRGRLSVPVYNFYVFFIFWGEAVISQHMCRGQRQLWGVTSLLPLSTWVPGIELPVHQA